MRYDTTLFLAGAGIAIVLTWPASAGDPLGTGFTYQGKLGSGGSLAEGPHDMEFAMFDAVAAGTQIGTTQVLDDVFVSAGLFTVELDFGASAFDGDARWLEITVEGFTLVPRQGVTPSPYSIQTRGIYVDGNLDIGLGTTSPQHKLDIVGDEMSMRLRSDTTTGSHLKMQSTYSGVATATLGSLDFDNHLGDTKASVTGLQTLFGTRLHLATEGTERLSIDQLGQVGIGTALPWTTLHVNAGTIRGRSFAAAWESPRSIASSITVTSLDSGKKASQAPILIGVRRASGSSSRADVAILVELSPKK